MRISHPQTERTKRRSIIFFEIGMIIALSITLWAFNISNRTSDIRVTENKTTVDKDPFDDILPPVNIIHPEEAIMKVRKTDKFKIVKDDTPPLPQDLPDDPQKIQPIIISDLNIKTSVIGQQIEVPEEFQDPVVFAQKMPSFPGGEAAMMHFINENIKYPSYDREMGIQGRCTVQFVIEKDGSISNISVYKTVSPGLDEEAMRVIRLMPKWLPGENNFKKVRVRMAIPIRFVLG